MIAPLALALALALALVCGRCAAHPLDAGGGRAGKRDALTRSATRAVGCMICSRRLAAFHAAADHAALPKQAFAPCRHRAARPRA